MTIEEQLTTIQDTQFFTDLRTQLRAIHTALTTTGFTVDGAIITQVGNVPVVLALMGGGNAHIKVGANDTGEPLYEWSAPIAWVS